MMDTHLLALQLMAAQGCLGAFDTLFHHELTEALPRQKSAGRELAIHALRASIYSALFIGLSAWEWHGVWALTLLVLFGVEIILTLWDFVIEDRTRLLPATERVTHTILAINGGAFIAFLALNVPSWLAQPSALTWHPSGLLSVFLALCGVGVGVSAIRDGFASRTVSRRAAAARPVDEICFAQEPQQVLVTGATGFIGHQLVRALLADGHQVIALTRRPRHAAWRFNGAVRCVADLGALRSDTPIDVIINLAGARILGLRWTAKRRETLLRSRTTVTTAVADCIRAASHKPRLLLSASAIGYYGIQTQDDHRALDETASPQPVFMSQLCQRWEEAANRALSAETAVVIVRLGLVFGRKASLPMLLLPIRLGLGGRLGSGRQWISWIHIGDVVRAIAHLCRTAHASGVYNLTAPEAVTQEEFSRAAGRLLKRPSILPTPAFPIRLLLGQQSDLLLEGQRVRPARLLQSGFAFEYPLLETALQDLA